MRITFIPVIFAAAVATGCGIELTQGNSEPFIVSVGPLTRAENQNVDIYFSVADFQNDDAEVEVKICTSKGCDIALSSTIEGDGSLRLSTVGSAQNKYSGTHKFGWHLPCGVVSTSDGKSRTLPLDETFWVEIRVVTNDDEPIKSPKYTLKKLGITKLPQKSC